MKISPRKREQLSVFLGTLSNATALKLFAAIEADESGGLPRDELLDDLRGQLLSRGAILPARQPDARRLFFTPFEDFLLAPMRSRKNVHGSPGVPSRQSGG